MATKFFNANPPVEVLATRAAGLAAPISAGVTLAGLARISALGLQNIAVDVGPGPMILTIVRDGKEITPPSFNVNRVDDFIAHSSILPRLRLPVAISQSIPAGTMVAKGTPIDIVLVPASDINFGLLQQVHDDMKNLAITAALPLIGDPQVAPLLAKDAADLSSDQKQLVSQKLQATLNVTVDDSNPAKTFALAFDALKSAQAFA